MNISEKYLKIVLLVAGLLLAGCEPEPPEVKILHSPVIAKSTENVTFTATVLDEGTGPVEVQIKVNAALVQTCPNLHTGDTCTYTGGPYSAYEGTTVSYGAYAKDSENSRDSKGYYYFAVTDGSYNWSRDYMPARKVGTDLPAGPDNYRPGHYNFDLLFHHTADYMSFDDFIDDVEDKMYDVFAEKEIIKLPQNYDDFDFYVYSKVAESLYDCGRVHADTDTDVPWRNLDAILHRRHSGDCTKGYHFSAEGGNTISFPHESSHGIFGLADEYDDYPSCRTGYSESYPEPNIWEEEADCRTEQTSKGRDPDACHMFTQCTVGWWGIHQDTDNTVMQAPPVYLEAHPSWGIEAAERVVWWFENQP